MINRNKNFKNLAAGYLFPEIGKRRKAFAASNPGAQIISLGIGNTTEPLTPHIVEAMKNYVDSLGTKEGYCGYQDDSAGFTELRERIAKVLYNDVVSPSEVFVSDGAKCDVGRLQQLFGSDVRVAVQDPAYPVYVDSSVAGGHTGLYDEAKAAYNGIVYMPSDAASGFVQSPPSEHADLVYLCFPNNPTGAVATKEQLKAFVDYAHRERAIIIFDSAYSDYISTPGIPHSIYEIEGAEDCAIEIGSFSKNAGFTGVRLGWSIVPEALKCDNAPDGTIHRLWNRRQCTFFNGASNIAQAGGLQALTDEGRRECMSLVSYYKENASIVKRTIDELGMESYGGIDSPYIWLRTPDGMTSWDFFDYLLEKAHVAVTPGSGFGKSGEGYVRISSYGHREDIEKACEALREKLR